MATPTVPASDAQARIDKLEKQVAGLMKTVTLMHEKMRMDLWKIPKPDQFLQAGPDGQKQQQSQAGSKSLTVSSAVKDSKAEPQPAKVGPFKYSPLKSESSEIRVISFLSANVGQEIIECEISTINLPETLRNPGAPRFMPLSYTWGSMDRSEPIRLNGHVFMVTKNLFKALKHFRDLDPLALAPAGYSGLSRAQLAKVIPRNWWVDAICINQADLDERKNQVALMTRLYRMAFTCHIWLGEDADDSSLAMGLIKNLSHVAPDTEQIDFVERKPGQTLVYTGPGTLPDKIPAEPSAMPDTEKERNYAAIVKLFNRDWFSRVWILQEMALPSTVKVHCGDQFCTWEEMMRTATLLVFVADEYKLPNLQRIQLFTQNSLFSHFQRVEQLSRLRNLAQSRLGSKAPYLSLSEALLFAKNSSATDLRDKVFAILPLVSPETTQVVADYRQSHIEIYRAAALNLSMQGLDFLSACQHVDGAEKEHPSWVPNFSQPWKYVPLLMTIKLKEKSQELDAPTATYLPEKSALMVKGYILDTVSVFCDTYISINSSRDEVENLKIRWEEYIVKKDINLSNRFGDHLESIRERSTFWPLYKQAYVGDKGDYADLSIRALNRHLVTSVADSDFDRTKRLGWYRNFAVGRRLTLTGGRNCGVVPADTRPGDKVCKFLGSDIIFILRESTPKHWIVVGDSYFFDHFSDYVISRFRPSEAPLQDICLV